MGRARYWRPRKVVVVASSLARALGPLQPALITYHFPPEYAVLQVDRPGAIKGTMGLEQSFVTPIARNSVHQPIEWIEGLSGESFNKQADASQGCRLFPRPFPADIPGPLGFSGT